MVRMNLAKLLRCTVTWLAGVCGCNLAMAVGLPPSFDCAKASTATEKTICGNPDLSDLDGRLGRAFSDVIAITPTSQLKEIRADQIAWIRNRDEHCAGDATCLEAYLSQRITVLSKAAARGRAAVATTQTTITAQPNQATNAQDAPFQRLHVSELLPEGTSTLLNESDAAFSQLDDRIKVFISAKNCASGLAICLTGAIDPHPFLVSLMQAAYGVNVNDRGYSYQDVPLSDYGAASKCMSDVAGSFQALEIILNFYMSQAYVYAGDNRYGPLVTRTKDSFVQWASSLKNSCNKYVRSDDTRPKLAYLTISKFLVHVDRLVSQASQQDAQTMVREKQERERIAEEARAKKAAAAAELARQEREEQLARTRAVEEQERAAAISADTSRKGRETKAQAKGYVDGWKQSEKCAPFRAKHDALKKEGDAGDIFAIQQMVHVDAAAELSGCKYNAQLDD